MLDLTNIRGILLQQGIKLILASSKSLFAK
jgi:hypothetical protein